MTDCNIEMAHIIVSAQCKHYMPICVGGTVLIVTMSFHLCELESIPFPTIPLNSFFISS